LILHSLTVLRVSLGLVFLAFGVLKFFPGVSPAQGLATRTTEVLTLGIVPDSVSLVMVALLECAIRDRLDTGPQSANRLAAAGLSDGRRDVSALDLRR
jgi:hypothetical protein